MARTALLIAVGAGVILAATAGVVLRPRTGSTIDPGTPTNRPPSGLAGEAVLDSARRLLAAGEFGKAEAVLRGGLAQSSEDRAMREALAEALLRQDRPDEAFEQYAELVAAGSDSAEVAFRAGSLAASRGDAGAALPFFERAQALDPANADYPVHLASAQIAMGLIEEAKASLIRAGVLDEGRSVVWGMLGELALRENRLDLAAHHIARARALDPDTAAWRVIEARVLIRRGEPERALLLLGGLGEADRWQAPIVKTMGECLGVLGRGQDALALHETAIERRPGDGELRFEAALWAERLGRRERAIELARQASMMGQTRARAILDRFGED
jgi:tetratricopeptide (TPR) repeat protein